jgi:hypothetical protein
LLGCGVDFTGGGVYLLLVVLVFAGAEVGFLLEDGIGAGVGSG